VSLAHLYSTFQIPTDAVTDLLEAQVLNELAREEQFALGVPNQSLLTGAAKFLLMGIEIEADQ
jgi:hypothetical protein